MERRPKKANPERGTRIGVLPLFVPSAVWGGRIRVLTAEREYPFVYPEDIKSANDPIEHPFIEQNDIKSDSCLSCDLAKEKTKPDAEPNDLSTHSSQAEHLLHPAAETRGITKTGFGHSRDFLHANGGMRNVSELQGPLPGERL